MEIKSPFTVRVLFLLIISFVFSQTYAQSKVQKLYESGNYMKCINISNKNIKNGKDKLSSYLYKSLSVIELYDSDKLRELYKYPVIEALKGIHKLEKFKVKYPSDYFYSENRYRIDKIIRFAERKADSLFYANNIGGSLRIYYKFRAIYPQNNYYLYKYSKLLNFNSYAVLESDKNLTEKHLHERMYEVFANCKKYFRRNTRKELIEDLNLLYNDTACDLQTASTILVLYPQKIGHDTEFEQQVMKFQDKYMQIKMLLEINKKRASGYVCGGLLIDPRPPLILSNCLSRTARKYAEYMQKENIFSHTGKGDSTPWQRAKEEGCSADAENIAANYTDNTKVVLKQWLDSEGHCKNIMGFHKEIGIGNAGNYWVQMFK